MSRQKGSRSLIKPKVEICICEMISKEGNTINKERKWKRRKRGLRRECGKCPCSCVEGCRAISEKQ